MTNEARWFAGIDWASQTHQVCLIDVGGKIIGERAFAHGGAGLTELCAWLLARTGAAPAAIAVAIEVPHGPIVEALLEHGFQVYAINPKQLDRFRDRFTVAGAKDDRRDALVLADSLRTDRHCLRRLAAEDAVVIELREWSRMTEDLQQERNRLANRMREQLWRYYPQALARSYHALRALSGVAPVTRRSGKRCIVARRQACQTRLRDAVYHWARVAIQHDELSRRRYAELRKRGHSHGRALRSVADRLLAVACAMLARQTPFDPEYAAKRAVA